MDKWIELLKDLGFEHAEERMVLKSLLEDEEGKLQEVESDLTDAALELSKLRKRVEVFGEEDLSDDDQEAVKLLRRDVEELEAERKDQEQRFKKLHHQLDALG